jgi:hypothetical protein
MLTCTTTAERPVQATAAAFIGDGDHFTTVIAAAAVVSAILILYPRWLGQEFPAHQK